jgi:hypothetical protein
MPLIKIFLAWNTSAIGGFFTDQEMLKFQKRFRQGRFYQWHPDSRLVTGSFIKIFNGVQENVEFLNF